MNIAYLFLNLLHAAILDIYDIILWLPNRCNQKNVKLNCHFLYRVPGFVQCLQVFLLIDHLLILRDCSLFRGGRAGANGVRVNNTYTGEKKGGGGHINLCTCKRILCHTKMISL